MTTPSLACRIGVSQFALRYSVHAARAGGAAPHAETVSRRAARAGVGRPRTLARRICSRDPPKRHSSTTGAPSPGPDRHEDRPHRHTVGRVGAGHAGGPHPRSPKTRAAPRASAAATSGPLHRPGPGGRGHPEQRGLGVDGIANDTPADHGRRPRDRHGVAQTRPPVRLRHRPPSGRRRRAGGRAARRPGRRWGSADGGSALTRVAADVPPRVRPPSAIVRRGAEPLGLDGIVQAVATVTAVAAGRRVSAAERGQFGHRRDPPRKTRPGHGEGLEEVLTLPRPAQA